MSEVLKVKLQRKVCLVCMMIRCTSRGLYSKHYFRWCSILLRLRWERGSEIITLGSSISTPWFIKSSPNNCFDNILFLSPNMWLMRARLMRSKVTAKKMATSVKLPWRNAACLMFMTGPFRYTKQPQIIMNPLSISRSPFISMDSPDEPELLYVQRHSKSGFMVGIHSR